MKTKLNTYDNLKAVSQNQLIQFSHNENGINVNILEESGFAQEVAHELWNLDGKQNWNKHKLQ